MDVMTVETPRQMGIYVRRARESQGLTRSRLAVLSGVSERLLASLELGDATGIRLDKLLAVLGALGLVLEIRGEKIAAPVGARAASTPRMPLPARSRHADLGVSLDYDSALRDFVAANAGVALPKEGDGNVSS